MYTLDDCSLHQKKVSSKYQFFFTKNIIPCHKTYYLVHLFLQKQLILLTILCVTLSKVSWNQQEINYTCCVESNLKLESGATLIPQWRIIDLSCFAYLFFFVCLQGINTWFSTIVLTRMVTWEQLTAWSWNSL